MVIKKLQNEKVDIKVVMSASDEDLIRLGVKAMRDRIRLREACRRVYTTNSSLRPLDISQGISTKRPSLEERVFLFSPSFGRNNGSRQKKRRSRSTGAAGSSIIRQQNGSGLVSLCVFRTSMPKKYLVQLKK